MKNINKFLWFLLIVNWQVLFAQVGIGTIDPNSSSILELNSNSKGFLIPRMNSVNRNNISNPATGLLIYNTDTSSFNYYESIESGWKVFGNNIKSYTISDMAIIGTNSSVDVPVPDMSISPEPGKYLLSFDSEYLNNYMTYVGANTTTLKQDFLSAYTILKAMETNVFSRTAFGNGEIIFSGRYSVNNSITISGSLILDAKGNPNALFVFKSSGAINVSNNATISLLNGALPENIFWISESGITVGTDATLKGNFMADTDITIGNSSSLVGKVLSNSGAITLGSSGIYTSPSKESSIINLGALSTFAAFSGSGLIDMGVSTYTGNIASGSFNITSPVGASVNGTIFPSGITPSINSGYVETDSLATFSIYQGESLIPNSVKKLRCNSNRSNCSLQTIVDVVSGQAIHIKRKISSGYLALGNRTVTLTSVK